MSQPAATTGSPPAPTPAPAPVAAAPSAPPVARRPIGRTLAMALVPLAVAAGGWWYWKSLAFVSTDDAYVNGHVTFVAPRVSGQVAKVLVDDNNRVRKGDLLVQLDKEPFLVAQRIASAAVDAAKADVIAALATTRATAAEVRTMRFALDHAIEDVNNQVALLKSRIASLESMKATEARARSDFDRTDKLAKSNATTQQQVDATQEALKVSVAHVAEALEQIHQVRVGLGLPATPPDGKGLDDVPADLNQTFSAVRQAQGALLQSAAKLGAVDSLSKSPKQMIADFYQRDPSGDVDKILEHLVENAPAVKQAQSRLLQAERSLAQADLNLKYTDVVAEIDGVVTRRNVNPGNNVVAGQALMAVRSLTEIWVDANFKETQIRELRIGQRVDLDVDMYGRHQTFEGRISGFTMGTGSTLALLPAQNATGNFVKVVQRLPVRIDILDYDPDRAPLFIGLSVEPRVFLHEPPQGPNAGKVLQPALVVGDAQR